ncbi:uncharacterized protein DUF3108 [Litorimonas taeanensis]|uniref:Uncharacterized protein DUF3108 n=1 Tax=Litorimonas taeanensis TaxID=568099 RepID=A0A420WCW2_9PROT|nr:DUF3108 domain-containing protein [Litorimonas taeanensis]RKQ68816.1 uncharacterized protein DUF3108 [Litorimonas taeanensis]
MPLTTLQSLTKTKGFRRLAAPLAAMMTLTALTSSIPASATDILLSERNIANLNARNLTETQYTLPSPDQSATQFAFVLKGYVFGLRMIRANYTGWYDESDYVLYADIKTSGLGALLKKMEIWAVSRGQHDQKGFQPDFHIQQNLDKKSRRVEMNYANPAGPVDVNIIPSLGSQGIPPASPAERFLADDTLSAILNLMMRGPAQKNDFCQGSIKVFDSKQHYALRLEPNGSKRLKFDGEKFESLRCDIYYVPISGFDPEDLPEDEEEATPVKAYFQYRPELDLYVPLRFTYKISGFTAVVKVDEIKLIESGSDVIQKLDD